MGIKFKFRYASTRDIGISVYLVLVVVFFYNQLPLEIIKPVFFADPLGALVGRQLTESGLWNPAWTGKKIFLLLLSFVGLEDFFNLLLSSSRQGDLFIINTIILQARRRSGEAWLCSSPPSPPSPLAHGLRSWRSLFLLLWLRD